MFYYGILKKQKLYFGKAGMGMRLQDFMDVKKLQKLQDTFSSATGFAVIIIDMQGRYVTKGSNFTEFCMTYTRGSKEGLRRCTKCDKEGKGIYECHAGLMEFSCDIVVKGEKLGAIIGGQVFTQQPDEDKFVELAKEFGIEPKKYIDALRKVPICKESQIKAAAQLLEEVINQTVNLEYIQSTDTSHMGNFNQEIGKTTETVREINQKTKELEKIAFRQNILALNASIEAARAGEAGVGFAVVAKQMGELSKKSEVIYQEITHAAEQIQSSIQKMNR